MRGSVTHVFRATRELTEPEGKRQRSSQLDDKLSSYQKFFGQIPSEGYQKASGKPTHPLGPTLAATSFCFLKPAYLVIKLPQIRKRSGLECPSRGPELPDTAQAAPQRKRGTRYPFLTRPRNGSKKYECSKSFAKRFTTSFVSETGVLFKKAARIRKRKWASRLKLKPRVTKEWAGMS